MSFTKSDLQEAQQLIDFYVDQLEHHRHLFQYHLAEDVVLDWFGQTVRGDKRVVEFLREKAASAGHLLGVAAPASKVGFRESHQVKVARTPKTIPVGLTSPPRRPFILKSQTKTPKKQPVASSSARGPRDLDGGTTPHRAPPLPPSPAKRMRTAAGHSTSGGCEPVETVEAEQLEPAERLRFAVAEGALEFRKPSSKRYQLENKWRRPCKLSVAYTSTSGGHHAIYLIIYEGNARCRRNLMKDFEAGEAED